MGHVTYLNNYLFKKFGLVHILGFSKKWLSDANTFSSQFHNIYFARQLPHLLKISQLEEILLLSFKKHLCILVIMSFSFLMCDFRGGLSLSLNTLPEFGFTHKF